METPKGGLYEVLEELEEDKMSMEDQCKMIRALKECEEKLENEFSKIFSFNYPAGTKLIVMELDSYDYDLSFGIYPYEDPYTPITSCAPLITSGSVDLLRYLDMGLIEQKDSEWEYVKFSEKLFIKWVSKTMPKFTDYKDFPYRIGRAFRGSSKCHDAITGKRI